jgi:glycosyltransferase involved in cell wall biosynthesis
MASKNNDVWVLTRPVGQRAIARELESLPRTTINMVYHKLPDPFDRILMNFLRGLPHYYLWHLTSLRAIRRLNREVRFDLAHQVTYVSFRFPSSLAWSGIPFVQGPIAGAEDSPWRFIASMGFRGALQNILRSASNKLVRFDPSVRWTFRKARVVLVATTGTLNALPRSVKPKCQLFPAVGSPTMHLDSPGFGLAQTPANGNAIRLLYVGELRFLKGVQFLLKALPRCHARGVAASVTLIGDGPFSKALQRLAQSLDIEESVSFRERLPRAAVLEEYAKFDAFVFPSLRDSGGFAVLEAMVARLPVICLDIGGPQMTVTADTGIRIKANDPRQVVEDLAEAILTLAGDPILRRRLGDAGFQRAMTEYAWPTKTCRLDGVYRTAVVRTAN